MELEEGSAEANPRVGLWAKVYIMTSPTHEYLGTIIALESYEAVTRNIPPSLQSRDDAESKCAQEDKVVKQLQSVNRGPFGGTVSSEDLSDFGIVIGRSMRRPATNEMARRAHMANPSFRRSGLECSNRVKKLDSLKSRVLTGMEFSF